MNRSKLRILLVIYADPPVLGGSEIEAQRVAGALIQRGHQVRVLCTGGPEMPPVRNWVDPLGVPVSILTRRSRGIWRDRAFAIRVAWHIWSRRGEFDLVYFLMQGLHLATGLPVAHALGKPSVMKISGDGILTTMSRSAIGRMELRCLRSWHVPLMLLNERMMAEAEASGFPRSQLVWMPNPVETDKFQPYSRQAALDWRIRHGLPVDAKLAIYTGRLSPEKGIRELMRGIAEAAEHHPDCMLVLVGDGPMRAELETLAREIDPAGSRFYFAGRAPLSEIPCWLGAADVFALTSPNEGFSCSLVEAMSVGLPSVVSDIDANVQLVTNDVHGLAVPWNQPSAIGVALSRLFANPASRGQLGAAARKRAVENYSIEKVVARYEVLFGHVLNSPKRTHQSTTKKRNTST